MIKADFLFWPCPSKWRTVRRSHMHLDSSISNIFFHGKYVTKPSFSGHFGVWEKPIRHVEIKCIEHDFAVSPVSMIKWSIMAINIPWCTPLRFYFRVQRDCSIRGDKSRNRLVTGVHGLVGGGVEVPHLHHLWKIPWPHSMSSVQWESPDPESVSCVPLHNIMTSHEEMIGMLISS